LKNNKTGLKSYGRKDKTGDWYIQANRKIGETDEQRQMLTAKG